MDQSADLHDRLVADGLADAAPYAVVMAYRVRFYMDMNAREAMHVIELRTAPAGPPVVPARLPADAPRDRRGRRPSRDRRGDAVRGSLDVELERLQSERALERKRREAQQTEG